MGGAKPELIRVMGWAGLLLAPAACSIQQRTPRAVAIGETALLGLLHTAAFIRYNLPNNQAITLTDQQATDIAAYVVSRPGPDFARTAEDWTRGDPPEDVAYPVRSARPPGKAPTP